MEVYEIYNTKTNQYYEVWGKGVYDAVRTCVARGYITEVDTKNIDVSYLGKKPMYYELKKGVRK